MFEFNHKPRLVFSNLESAKDAADWYFEHQIGKYYPVSVVVSYYGYNRESKEYTVRFKYSFPHSPHELYRVDSFDVITARKFNH